MNEDTRPVHSDKQKRPADVGSGSERENIISG